MVIILLDIILRNSQISTPNKNWVKGFDFY